MIMGLETNEIYFVLSALSDIFLRINKNPSTDNAESIK